jgi:hypothetical protein
MWGMVHNLVKLDRGGEALPVIDQCVRHAAGKVLRPRLLTDVMDLRLRHFEKAGNAAGCRQTAEIWESLNRTDADSLYRASSMRAVTAAVSRATAALPAGGSQADSEADRAMVWLKQAVASGYKHAAQLKRDRDLDALRDRADFRQLLTTLEGIRD